MARVSVTFLGAIAVGYAFLGCGEAGNGVLKSESRDVPAFSRITNSSAVNVYITIGGSTATLFCLLKKISGLDFQVPQRLDKGKFIDFGPELVVCCN